MLSKLDGLAQVTTLSSTQSRQPIIFINTQERRKTLAAQDKRILWVECNASHAAHNGSEKQILNFPKAVYCNQTYLQST